MKIVALLPAYRPSAYSGHIGGGEISNRILLEGLAAAGHCVTVFALSAGGDHESIENGVRVVEAQGFCIGRRGDWLAKRLVYRRHAQHLVEQARPEVLIAATEAVAIGVKLSQVNRIPLAVFVRAFENLEPTVTPDVSGSLPIKERFKRIVLGDYGLASIKQAALLLPNSSFMEQICQEQAPQVPTSVVYPPIDIDERELCALESTFTVSMVGTSVKKGTDLVLRIAKQMPELQFRIVGCPGIAPGEAIVEGNVTHIGWCNTRTEFREHADIVLVPSLWQEPFGRVAIEALAAGRIALVSDVGGLPEAVAYEPDLIVPVNDEAAWFARIRDVIEDRYKYWMAAESARASLRVYESVTQVAHLEQQLMKMGGVCRA